MRRLLAREGDHDGPKAREALRRVCMAVTDSLRESLGQDGCDALIARALARTQGEHPVLKEVPRSKGAGVGLDEVVASDAVHTPAVAAALEALLTAVLDILARLIGEDMATRIIDPDALQNPDREGQSP